MSLIIIVLVFIIFIFLLQYFWGRRHIYRLANTLPGPLALPVIGNALKFLCAHEDMLSVITNETNGYSKPLRFWLGQDLLILFNNPEHVKKILLSSKLAHKHDIYDFLKIYVGDGLITNSGEKYRQHRRLIQPLINLKFVTGNFETFQRHTNVLLEELETRVDKGMFNIHHFVHNCFADIVGESLLGIKIDAQRGKNVDYIQASLDLYPTFYDRIMKPWLHPDWIYRFTKGKKQQNRIVNVTTKFIKHTISNAWSRKSLQKGKLIENCSTPLIDQIINITEKDPNCMDDTDLLNHMLTIYGASEDTMTIISAGLCVCLGMYPEYQEIAANEIRSVCGITTKEVTYEDVIKLQYLDMCIKDVLRLIPIAPFIMRKTLENYHIDTYTIPKGCGILVSIFDIHRDPEHWENPEHFHPNHFLPRFVEKRHPFAYVPFSAGPRGCIGKAFANNGIKVFMANILKTFEIEADGKFPDLALKSDISVRLRNGYNVRLKKRIWK